MQLSSKSEKFEIFPVGYSKTLDGNTWLEIDESYLAALEQLEHFNYIRILWWFHRFEDDRCRSIIQCKPPYENAPRAGVFATRSPVQPNPIGLTTVKLDSINLPLSPG